MMDLMINMKIKSIKDHTEIEGEREFTSPLDKDREGAKHDMTAYTPERERENQPPTGCARREYHLVSKQLVEVSGKGGQHTCNCLPCMSNRHCL